MIGLAGISALVGLIHPLSAGFSISLAVIGNGVLEMRWARRLAALDARAPQAMALNQLALGLEIAAYAAWQWMQVSPQAVGAALGGRLAARVLSSLPPELVAELVAKIPPMLRLSYTAVGAGAVVGCGCTAWYYAAKRREVALLAPRAK